MPETARPPGGEGPAGPFAPASPASLPGVEAAVATKLLIPQSRPGLVARAGLIARLDQCVRYKLTLVSAPAGFGKSTLVAAWARDSGRPVAWLSLEEADSDWGRFLRYLAAALQRIDPQLLAHPSGQDLLAAVHSSDVPAADAAVAALVNDLAGRPDDLTLVLDDFHLIDDETVHNWLRRLVTQAPPQLHLIIATREDPPLPLARLRGRGELLELRGQDLRFSAEEAMAFLVDTMHLSLSPGDVAELDRRVEGWIAGLQLAALSMQKRERPAELIPDLSGRHHFIMGYLTEEVLHDLPDDVRSFMLQTSVLERLSGSLCEALTGRSDGQVLLEHLCAANVFLTPLDEEHTWYRYHHLFADLLRNRLRATQPGLMAVLHARASEWYERAGSATDAVDHALAARDYQRAVRLIEANARDMVLQGYVRTVEEWLQALPAEWRRAGPRAGLAFVWSLLMRGRFEEIEPYLRDAETAAAPAGNQGDGGADAAGRDAVGILAESRALRAAFISLRGDPETGYQMARSALEAAQPDDPFVLGAAYFALGTACNYSGRAGEAIEAYRSAIPLCRAAGSTVAAMMAAANLALLHITRGRLHEAVDLCLEVIGSAARMRSGGPGTPAMASVYGAYVDVLYEWDELEQAADLTEQWTGLGRLGGHIATLTLGGVMLSKLTQAKGDLAGARAALDEPASLLSLPMPAWVKARYAAGQVSLALAEGDRAAARRALEAGGVTAGPGSPAGTAPGHMDHMNEVLHIARLRMLLATASEAGNLAEAIDLAGLLLAASEPAGRSGRVIEVLALRALAYQAAGRPGDAAADLRRALALAEPEGYVRTFVDEGEPMRRLLESFRALEENGDQRPAAPGGYPALLRHVDRLLRAFPSTGRRAAPGHPGEEEPAPPDTGVGASPFGGAGHGPSAGSGTSPSPASSGPRPQPEARPTGATCPLVEQLTERELEVLRLIARGMTYEETARQLVVSLNTVRFHVKSIYGKLGVERRAAAVEAGRALGLL